MKWNWLLTATLLFPSIVAAADQGKGIPQGGTPGIGVPGGDVHLLWPSGAPQAKGQEPADKPTVSVFRPAADQAVPTAVVVCPGGGYGHLAQDHEGKQIAVWLNQRGITAVVLLYRLAPKYGHPIPMLDVQRAIRWTRSQASELGIRPDRVGVWGFSAGGHLASTALTHFDDGDTKATDPIDRLGCRPDFGILAYPVISFEDANVHKGSRQNLLGKEPDPKLIEYYSNDKQVTAKTPPTFLFHTTEDKAVLPINSVLFYSALIQAGVPAELHIYEKGRHGVGLAANLQATQTWPDRLNDWLALRGMLTK